MAAFPFNHAHTLPPPESYDFTPFLNSAVQWRAHQLESHMTTIMAGVLCFIAASISSAGGIGGGALFISILNLVAGLDLKKATPYSAFMVSGVSLSNVMYNLCIKGPCSGGKSAIDYDIALLSVPCMLLGVSVGVICHFVFPDWLITVLFAIFLACSTFRTCRAGCRRWKAESDEVRRNGLFRLESGIARDGRSGVEGEEDMEEPLLGRDGGGFGISLKKVLLLVMVWLSFFLLHVLTGEKDGKRMIHIKPCGLTYWLITLSQIPLAMIFTTYVLYERKRQQDQTHSQGENSKKETVHRAQFESLPKAIFPISALLTGILGGLFGIGGGLLINPILLQIGVPPEITAATSAFMILFASSMSSVQYLMLGMKGVNEALVLGMGCFLASPIGLVIIQRAIAKYKRTSLIVFTVSLVMVLSTVSITFFGAMDVWREYISGQYMGFKLPC